MREVKAARGLRQPGVLAALTATLLFGSGTPLSKKLLASIDPWLLAGLLYLGSGLGLSLYRALRRQTHVAKLSRADWPWFAGAIAAGGILAPVLLMFGLRACLLRMPRSCSMPKMCLRRSWLGLQTTWSTVKVSGSYLI